MIVESPAKAKTITKYLKTIDPTNSYVVKASYGHIRDLEKKKMGIDLNNGFEQKYVVIAGKHKILNELVSENIKADMVYLASDNDREGESIAWHLRESIPMKGRYKRIVFNEITKNGLSNAISNPRDIDMSLVDAQQTRRVIDRVLGFKLTPLLWKHFKTSSKLSAGRVQSATLKLIIDKENDILKHVSMPYWSFLGSFNANGFEIENAKLYKDTNICKLDNKQDVESIFKKLKNKFQIVHSEKKTRKEYPDMPFITSSLQQEAYNKLGMNAKLCMKIAQDLYEDGHITYMRTDSFNISKDACSSISKKIKDTYGEEYFGPIRLQSKKTKGAQEAHESIRPTNIDFDLRGAKYTAKHIQLYDLIWKRTMAALMSPAIYDDIFIDIQDDSFDKDMRFLGKLSFMKFDGFKVLYDSNADEKQGSVDEVLQKLECGKGRGLLKCNNIRANNTWTSAPTRFNEPTLIKTLESNGIGRPSTYASILEKLYEKQYITIQNEKGIEKDTDDMIWTPGSKVLKKEKGRTVLNAETNRMVPTEIGIRVNMFLDKHFPTLISSEFTANMENQLDAIANGDVEKLKVLKEFWVMVESMSKVDMGEKEVLENESRGFTVNGKVFTVRLGRYGPIIEESEKQSYIGLTPYLKLQKMAYTDMKQEDVELLLSLPKHFKDGTDLSYGRYGFYLKNKSTTAGILPGWIKKNLPSIYNIVNLSDEQIKSLFQERADAKTRTRKHPKKNITSKKT